MTDTLPDFMKEDEKEPVQSDILTRLMKLASAQIELEKEIAEYEKAMEAKKIALNSISQEEIPNLLKSHGLSNIKLSNGMNIKIMEDINVTIVDEPQFFKFLEEKGADDLIKTQLSLGKQEAGELPKLYKFLEQEGIEYSDSKTVHPQTKKKYFKTLCGLDLEENKRMVGYMNGTLTPPSKLPEFCKVFTINKTKITKKK